MMDRPVADDWNPGDRHVLGVQIALWPPLLPWLVAGSAMLMMAFVMGGVGGCSDGVMVSWAGAPPPARADAVADRFIARHGHPAIIGNCRRRATSRHSR